MKTLLEPTRWPTPEEMQALIRQAHAERTQAIWQLLASLFRTKGVAKGEDAYAKHAALRPTA